MKSVCTSVSELMWSIINTILKSTINTVALVCINLPSYKVEFLNLSTTVRLHHFGAQEQCPKQYWGLYSQQIRCKWDHLLIYDNIFIFLWRIWKYCKVGEEEYLLLLENHWWKEQPIFTILVGLQFPSYA